MQLNRNVGTADRIVRIAVGIALLSVVFLTDGPQRWLGLIGIVPLLTAVLRFCPLYSVLGMRAPGAPKPGT